MIDASDGAIGRLLPKQSDGGIIDAATILVANGLLPDAMVATLQTGLSGVIEATRAAGSGGHTGGLAIEDLAEFELDVGPE